jgi:hypothetical protein
MGLRYGEIRGLLWENYQNEAIQVTALSGTAEYRAQRLARAVLLFL